MITYEAWLLPWIQIPDMKYLFCQVSFIELKKCHGLSLVQILLALCYKYVEFNTFSWQNNKKKKF